MATAPICKLINPREMAVECIFWRGSRWRRSRETSNATMQVCFFISESFWMLCLLPGMLFPSVPHCCYCSYCGLVARKKNKEDWNECNCYDFFVFLTGSLGKYSPWICAKFRRHYVFQFLLEGGFWC